MASVTAYIGRDNIERLELLQDGVAVVAGAVTRAVLKFGSFCLDTDEITHASIIYFETADNLVLCLCLGLVTDIRARVYEGKLTLWDATTTEGYAWDDVTITGIKWPVCPAPGP
jgi:hypothetical protein